MIKKFAQFLNLQHGQLPDKIRVSGRFDYKVFDRAIFDAHGNKHRGQLRSQGSCKNGATTIGMNRMLDVMFEGGSVLPNWYGGLIDGTPSPVLATADTMSSHAGWVENDDYDEATRPEWAPNAAAGGSSFDPVLLVYTSSGTEAFAGAFLVSNSTKAGSTGILWATGLFSAVQNLTVGQELTLAYTVTLAPG